MPQPKSRRPPKGDRTNRKRPGETSKPLLSAVLSERIDKLGISRRRVAATIGVPISTLKNSISRNVYDEILLKRLLSLVGWDESPADLKATHEFDLTTWPGARRAASKFSQLLDRAKEFAEQLAEVPGALGSVMQEMESGDAMCFIGREEGPLHIRDRGHLALEAAKAAERGVGFVYVRPSDAAIKHLRDFHIELPPSEATLINEFSTFVSRVKERTGTKSVEDSFALVLSDSLVPFYGSEPRAYHRYGVSSGTESRGRRAIFLARVPVSDPHDREGEAFMLLGSKETEHGGNVIEHVLRNARRDPDDEPGVFRSPVVMSEPSPDCAFRELRNKLFRELTGI